MLSLRSEVEARKYTLKDYLELGVVVEPCNLLLREQRQGDW